MKKTKIITIYLVIFFGLLLLFPKTCIDASKSALLLWFNHVIPSLFPFMILSYIMMYSPIINLIHRIFTPLFKKTFGLSGSASYVFILGSLSGYPMGGILINELVTTQKITHKEGEFLLTFCNNPSPMFVIGYICTDLLNKSQLGWPVLISIYIGNFITAVIMKKLHYKTIPTDVHHVVPKRNEYSFHMFDGCIFRTAEILVKIGGYMILFSIPIMLLSESSIQYPIWTFLLSLIELSNGAHLLATMSASINLKISFIASLCAFGSLSVLGQTASVVSPSKLKVKPYFIAKSIHAISTFIIAWMMMTFFM